MSSGLTEQQQEDLASKLSPVYKLGAADFVLLSLLAVVLLYILPRKLISVLCKRFGSPLLPAGPKSASAKSQ